MIDSNNPIWDNLMIDIHVVTLDMGKSFPLKHVIRPDRENAVYAFLATTLLLVLPIAFLQSKPGTFFEVLNKEKECYPWLLIGLIVLLLAFAFATNKISFTITKSTASVMIRRFFRSRIENEPLANYSSLSTMSLHISSRYLRRKSTLYQIELVHEKGPFKSIILFAGKKKKKFEARLEAYKRLLGKPLI